MRRDPKGVGDLRQLLATVRNNGLGSPRPLIGGRLESAVPLWNAYIECDRRVFFSWIRPLRFGPRFHSGRTPTGFPEDRLEWEINGDDHEYAFGPKFDRDGNLAPGRTSLG
jgi:hypothetical protein